LIKKKSGGYELTAPKTRAGISRFTFVKNTLKVLQEHRQTQFPGMRAAGANWHDHDFIFTSNIITPMDHSNFRWFFKALPEEAGLRDIHFHDLHHSAASRMLNNGIPLIVVSRLLGHTQASITLDGYGHLIPGRQQETASLMDDPLTPSQNKFQHNCTGLHQKRK
jgi:integrase